MYYWSGDGNTYTKVTIIASELPEPFEEVAIKVDELIAFAEERNVAVLVDNEDISECCLRLRRV